MPFEIVRNDIVNMQVDAVVILQIPLLSSDPVLTAGYIKKLDVSCFWRDRKSAASSLVMRLSLPDLDWMPNMLYIR